LAVGEVWYGLYVDGEPSDLAAIFRILRATSCLTLRFEQMHVI